MGLLRRGSSYLRLTGRSLVRVPAASGAAATVSASAPAPAGVAATVPALACAHPHAPALAAAPTATKAGGKIVLRGGAAYELAHGGRALRRVVRPAAIGSTKAVASSTAYLAGISAAATAAPGVGVLGRSSSTAAAAAPAPAPKAKRAVRPPVRVQLGLAEFVRSADGKSLQRSKSTRLRQAASGRLRQSIDFKRQRERQAKADARQQAASGVQCSYFSKFGRCCRAGGECLYEHDPEKLAICLPYLHGTCTDPVCLLSHEPTPQRMPVCRLFLLGVCLDKACPFVHVHLGHATPLCDSFTRCGWCEAGAQCEQRHERWCEGFSDECPLGDQCRLSRHRRTNSSKAAAAASIVPPPALVSSPSTFPRLSSASL